MFVPDDICECTVTDIATLHFAQSSCPGENWFPLSLMESTISCLAGFAAGMESLEKVWISFLRIPDLEIVWKLMKSFGKRWRVLENSFFEKDVFFFFRAGARSRRSRPAQALAKRCTFDLTVSCHGQLVHFRSRRGRGPLLHQCMQVDRVHRLEHPLHHASGNHTHRKDHKEGGRNAFDRCFAFPDLGPVGRSISLRFSDRRGSPYSKWESASFQRCSFSDDRFKSAFACPWEK